MGKIGGDDGLAGARRAREENAAATEKSFPAQHRVEPGDASANPLVGTLVVQPQRGDGHHAEAVPADEKGEFVGAVRAPRYFTTRKCRVAIWSLTR